MLKFIFLVCFFCLTNTRCVMLHREFEWKCWIVSYWAYAIGPYSIETLAVIVLFSENLEIFLFMPLFFSKIPKLPYF